MSLQLLRGTTSQRTAFTPAASELVFDLTEQALYIGNGSTPGGILVNGGKFSPLSHGHVPGDISGLAAALPDLLNGTFLNGANITITYDSGTKKFTIASASGVTAKQAEQIRLSRLSSEAGYAQFIKEFCDSPSAATILAEVDPTGVYDSLDAHIVRNKIARFVPHGNGVGFTRSGCSEVWPEGTLTPRTIASTNDITRLKRCGIVSPATTTGACGWTHDNAGVFIGDGTRGGFTTYAKFIISDASLVATARMFCGATADVSTPANTDPSGMLNSIGFGRGNTQNTMRLYYGGSAAQASIDLGASFPVNTTSTDIYEIGLFAFPKLANKIGYFVKRTLTGDTAHGILSAATSGVQLPSPNTPLNPFRFFRSTNGTATAVGIDLFEMMQGYRG